MQIIIKMKNIFLLLTDKPSRLHFDDKLFLSTNPQISKDINSIVEGRNIYITSDEEIISFDEINSLSLQDGKDIQTNMSNI